ncbi:sulfotransferase [Acaryochloris sp. IP29b_bin.148]|uniref:sulfotransferase family protein n=1 Tax=Acaryochloris sp. IP29b_bin.148 TaxID=2969218 RepID=UPI00263700CD|nr:sulfotransferase [Acaryochloris sp. IP29b_bin.148]
MNNNSRLIDVMIAGAQKSGTTSLAKYLAQHPQITTHKQMEMTFFVNSEEYQRGYKHAVDQYFPADSVNTEFIMGKSVGIMYFKHAMQRLYEHNPNCKIIVILRNPVSRAYSAYWYMRRVGYETVDSFAKALELESYRKTQNDLKSAHCLYRDRGLYHHQIKNLHEVFGSENVYTLLLEDLTATSESIFPDLLSFIGVDNSLKIEVKSKNNQAKKAKSEFLSKTLKSDGIGKSFLKKIVPVTYLRSVRNYIQKMNEESFEIPEMQPAVKSELVDFFRPHNQELEKLINRDLSHWSNSQ